MNAYAKILKRLYEINAAKAMKLGLENMVRMDALLGYPSKAFHSVHIAGTNGKGSVTSKIAKGLEGKYKQVGLYISPHISTFRERICINQQLIPEEAVASLMQQIFTVADQAGIFPTIFEYTTLLAFKYFASMKVEAAVFETGLGGRLDATNIITPLLSVITSIDFDHIEVLGKTLPEIAAEKGGIIKPGIPVVLGPTANIVPVKEGCKTIQISGKYPTAEIENRTIARAAMEHLGIPEPAIKKGLTTRLPCRRERVLFDGKEVLLDVAHNPIGLVKLFEELQLPPQKIRVICGLSKSKDLDRCLKIMGQKCQDIHLVHAASERAASAETLLQILLKHKVDPSRIKIHSSISECLTTALKLAAPTNQQVVVCGTFFIMAEARQALGISEPRDPYDLNEGTKGFKQP